MVPAGGSFVYLGKIFNFDLKKDEARNNISEKLTTLLRITSQLKMKPQWKLAILRRYIHAQLSFELRLYDFGVTWVEQHLDSVCYQHVRNWLGQPISSCIKEVAVMPKSRCGLDVPSFRDTFERLWMKKRHKLKHSMEPEIQQIWKDSSYKNITVDRPQRWCYSHVRPEQPPWAARTHGTDASLLTEHSRSDRQVCHGINQQTEHHQLVIICGDNASVYLQFCTEGFNSTTADSIQSSPVEENCQSDVQLVQFRQSADK